MDLDIVLYVVSGIMLLVGLIGCVVPMLPGRPISYAAMIVLLFTSKADEISVIELVILALAVVVVTIIDYVAPTFGAKKLGGSKYGNWGCTIGTIAGLFLPPLGIIICPFVGAVIGELIGGKKFGEALQAGVGSFLGFMLSTGLKLIVCLYMIGRFIFILM